MVKIGIRPTESQAAREAVFLCLEFEPQRLVSGAYLGRLRAAFLHLNSGGFLMATRVLRPLPDTHSRHDL